MKKLFLLLTILLFLTICLQAQQKSLPRIGIAGIRIECSTFSPALTEENAFTQRQGEDLINIYPFLKSGTPLREKAVWLPAFSASATPGGTVTREAYESFVNKTLDLLKKMRLMMPCSSIYMEP